MNGIITLIEYHCKNEFSTCALLFPFLVHCIFIYMYYIQILGWMYINANCADPDQTAPKQFDQGLHCLPNFTKQSNIKIILQNSKLNGSFIHI